MEACYRSLFAYGLVFVASLLYLSWYNARRKPRWLHHIISTFAVSGAILSFFYALPTVKYIC